MYRKVIKYEDYDGNKREEPFYFNLSKAELTEMELGVAGGMKALIDNVIQTQDTKRLIEIFKDMILRSYGEKSPDGKYFDKSEEISRKFAQTEAYSELFMELATNADAAVEFVNGIIPNIPAPDGQSGPKNQNLQALDAYKAKEEELRKQREAQQGQQTAET